MKIIYINFLTVELSKSKLSAEAKEWYPPNYVPQPPVVYSEPYRVQRFSSVQDRIRQAQEQDSYNFDEMSYSLEESDNMDLRVHNYCIFYFVYL